MWTTLGLVLLFFAVVLACHEIRQVDMLAAMRTRQRWQPLDPDEPERDR